MSNSFYYSLIGIGKKKDLLARGAASNMIFFLIFLYS